MKRVYHLCHSSKEEVLFRDHDDYVWVLIAMHWLCIRQIRVPSLMRICQIIGI